MAKEKLALISVYNKTGIEDFAKRLVEMGWKIISSGGTAKVIAAAGVPVTDVAEITGLKPMLKHRVATLHPKIHGGLIADYEDPDQVKEMEDLTWSMIDLACIDFYPLAEAIAKPGATIESVVELTDIGGPAMSRSAAKGARIIICRFEDREAALSELERTGDVHKQTRQYLRARAEYEVAKYGGQSAVFHGQHTFSRATFSMSFGEAVVSIPKGENGAQSPATGYTAGGSYPLSPFKCELIEGSPLGYCNWTDIDRLVQTVTHLGAAIQRNNPVRLLSRLTAPAIAVGVKHGNPCGAAVGVNPVQVARKMVMGDSLAIFGGWIMCNFPVTIEVAQALATYGIPRGGEFRKFDGIVAPDFASNVSQYFERKGGRCRMMINPALATHYAQLDITPINRPLAGGDFIIQPNYTYVPSLHHGMDLQIYGANNHSASFLRSAEFNLLLAWGIGATSNSNTITICNQRMLLGNGVGQQARVWAAKLAVMRARDAGHSDLLRCSFAYSDSFFPFPDAAEVLIKAGVRGIFSTSGSKAKGGGDAALIELCQKRGVLLYMIPDDVARGFCRH